jgi:hypothetical protein
MGNDASSAPVGSRRTEASGISGLVKADSPSLIGDGIGRMQAYGGARCEEVIIGGLEFASDGYNCADEKVRNEGGSTTDHY